MSRFIFSFILIFGLVSIGVSHPPVNKGVLTIKLIGFRNDKGQVCVSLFNNPKGFPGNHDKAFKIMRSGIRDQRATIEFTDLTYGTYAVGVLHDENLNNKMDTNFIGMPKEGFGASNNPKSFMGPPSFESAVFEINSNNKTIEINIKYL
jgi:uncharacterized protein (DUF2141 family)